MSERSASEVLGRNLELTEFWDTPYVNFHFVVTSTREYDFEISLRTTWWLRLIRLQELKRLGINKIIVMKSFPGTYEIYYMIGKALRNRSIVLKNDSNISIHIRCIGV